MKKYASVLLMIFVLVLSGCRKGNTDAEAVFSMPEASAESVLMDRTFPASKEYVKLTGRTAEDNGIRWLIHSASKAEFRMTGTRASVVICADDSIHGEEKNFARIAVYVNGQRTMDHIVTAAEETLEVFSSDEEKTVEISIIKLSEALCSIVGIKEIQVTSSCDIESLPEHDRKIEFIGDSVTCGYGIDDENPTHDFSTATEDVTKTYAYKTAQALNADYSFVSYSGYGIVSGYTPDGPRADSKLVPPIYEILGKTDSNAALSCLSAGWDFSEFVPDEIVINLGTNDDCYTKGDSAKEEEFISLYVDFLKMIRQDNPGAHVIASLGLMQDNLYPAIEEAVERYTAETRDENISVLHFMPQDGSTGYAADMHPTEKTNDIAARTLIDHLDSE